MKKHYSSLLHYLINLVLQYRFISKPLIVFLLFFSATIANVAPVFSQITFLESIGNITYEQGLDGMATSNGEYVLAGSVTSATSLGEGWIVRLNVIGDTLWAITTGGTNNEAFYSIAPASDGGFVAGGYSQSFGSGNTEYYAVKVDAAGSIQWSNVYGSAANSEEAYKIIGTGAGYLLAGFGGPFASSYPIYLINLDANGGVLWARSIGGDNNEGIKSVIHTSDGGYAIVGSEYADFESHIMLAKLSNLGKVEWAKKYAGEVFNDVAQALVATSDGGYAISGYSSNWGTNTDMFLIKTDGAGNLSSAKHYGTSYADFCNDLEQTSDGGFILAGYNEIGAIIVKTNSTGDTLWTRSFAGLSLPNLQLNAVSLTPDNGYLLTGTIQYDYSYDLFVAKTNANGYVLNYDDPYDSTNNNCPVSAMIIATSDISPAVSNLSYTDTTEAPFVSSALNVVGHSGTVTQTCFSVGIEDIPVIEGSLNVYPSPANEKTNLRFTSGHNGEVEIQLINMSGQIVFEDEYYVMKGENEIQMNTSGFENGIYSIDIRTGSTFISNKLVILRE